MSNDTSVRLSRVIPRILAEWEQEARKNILSSRGLTSLVLKDSLNSFLTQITKALSANIARTNSQAVQDEAEMLNFTTVHGGERASVPLHYTLAEVILEFQILQRIILQVLEEEAPIPIADRNTILCKVGEALSGAATHFADLHKQIQEQFALTLVHDLRNPINVVKMSAYCIKQQPSALKKVLYCVATIDKNMDRFESMLKELLDVSRLKAGMGLAFELAEFRLDELAQEVVLEMKETHGERFILHTTEPTSGSWNRAGIRRLLENLILNALKYGSEDTPVTVTVWQNATRAILTVQNEGNPIPIAEQPQLFEMFSRATSATGKTGWGLGLALVSEMVRAHQGSVRIESSLEWGTNFIVELPKKQN